MLHGEMGPSTDGRRRRSEQSRAKIVEAMLALVKDGHIEPTAEDVAARAQIGLRSVFRHFADMESLRAEMAIEIARIYGNWFGPLQAGHWSAQLKEMCDRRCSAYEEILPYKNASDTHRHKSPALAENYDRILEFMRARLRGVLPPEAGADQAVFESLDLTLSFETWQRLRGVQKLTSEDTRKVINVLVHAIFHKANIAFD